jgi:hypothetical protein
VTSSDAKIIHEKCSGITKKKSKIDKIVGEIGQKKIQ